MNPTRRTFIKTGLAAGLLSSLPSVTGLAKTSREDSMPIPLIHCTDLYHFPADPDDDWDLATCFALAVKGNADLKAIIIDHCQASYRKSVFWVGDPGVLPVAQMNHITGLAVPAAVGSSRNLASPTDKQDDASRSDKAASNLILRVLEESATPVAITMVGSCKEVALAANRNPDLFRRKCPRNLPGRRHGHNRPSQGCKQRHQRPDGSGGFSRHLRDPVSGLLDSLSGGHGPRLVQAYRRRPQ